MSYAIIRNSNYKKDNLAGIYKHNERKNTNYSNKDINKENSIFNYSLKECKTTYLKAINNLKEKFNLQGRITSYTNLLCEFIITSDREFFEGIGKEETKRYFKVAYEFVASYQNLGDDFIISAKIHMDETTPHMHIVFIPVIHKMDTKSGKLTHKIACSEYWKGKDSYKKLQDAFYKYVTDKGFDLERGKNINAEHLSTEKFKQVTEYENIKFEMENKKIKRVDETNLPMLIAQNRSLVLYANKLKGYLAKSYKAIEQVEKLKIENEYLQQENRELKRKNNFLQQYIRKTFECASILFNFPKDRLRRLVNDFFDKTR